jgi:hypothetical protein
LDGEAFILQEQGVFTRIGSGAPLVASGSGARGFSLPCAAAEATVEENSIGSIRVTTTGENEKTYGFQCLFITNQVVPQWPNG